MSNARPMVITLALMLALMSSTSAHAVSILFVGNSATASSGADASVFSQLQARYGAPNVSYLQASAAVTGDITGFDALVISSTPGSGDIRSKWHDSAIGIVNWEEAVMDSGSAGEFGLSTVTMTKSTTTTQITIDTNHFITQGLSGTIDFVTSGETLNSSALAPSAFSLASAANGTGTGNSAIFAVEAGGVVGINSPAEGRRVMFGITDSTFNNLTTDGRNLFLRSVDWAAGLDNAPPPPTPLITYSFPDITSAETGSGYAASILVAGVTASDVSATGSLITTTIEDLGYATAPVIRVFPTDGNTSAATAVAGNKFFEFTISADGTSVDLTEITFDAARGGAGTPRGWALASSLDGFATLIDSEEIGTVRTTMTNYSISLDPLQFSNITGDVTFRMYVFSPGNGSTVEFDNITVIGSVNAIIPEPATASLALLGLGGLMLRRRRAA